MFDITSDDIIQLNDTDLRELVGRLCEAELEICGLSPSAVTWGGDQSAADGGLDVRVALPADATVEGFIPRPSSGFQVKKPDMPRSKIIDEMKPDGDIRPVIQELADENGAYVIVSSKGSTADSALRNRKKALRDALENVVNADQLYTDFYDRTRLASWVRCHPGLGIWVREKVGRTLVGWRPYGPWAGGAEGVNAEYLLDDKLRLYLRSTREGLGQSVAEAIDEFRDILIEPQKSVRLVGLSGVGKTRLAQALFDNQVGTRPLPVSLAIYTNLSDDPVPQPIGMVSDLIAFRRRGIIIVDNCPPDLHRSLSELCRKEGSTVSILTIEYDVRDDQPEGTEVVRLDTSSAELIEKLVRHRFPHISQVDARTIAEASGGNARIAIALSETVEQTESIAGLSDEELFQRLFRQRQETGEAFYLAAQACSLVYSFQGEMLTGEEAELPRLAELIGQNAGEIYRYVSELKRRDLVQQRGVWRAVLPHAIANRLAVRALEDIPYDIINQQLVAGGTDRLARSFSRRLSFLHESGRARAIVEKWLRRDGLLGDLAIDSELIQEMFENVAPVLPESALAVLERVRSCSSNIKVKVWGRHRSLLRSLAYDPDLFKRSTEILIWTSLQRNNDNVADQALDTFLSLFTIILSGTHATVEQRLEVVEQLLKSDEAERQVLGLRALDKILTAGHFSHSCRFEFGARSRDFGYWPRSDAEMSLWYRAALTFLERVAFTERLLKQEMRNMLARRFRDLWATAHMYSFLERLSIGFSADGFWREGWVACRQTMNFDKNRLLPEAISRLSALEQDLKPANLVDKVRGVVLGDRSGGIDLEEIYVDGEPKNASERLQAIARKLGCEVARNEDAFASLLPDLLRGGMRVWEFGRGFASASPNIRVAWKRLVENLEKIDGTQVRVEVFCGILAELWMKDNDLAQNLLDSVVDQPALVSFLPELHSGIALDERGVERLKGALLEGKVPVQRFRTLAFGRTTDNLAGGILKGLILLIADHPDGWDEAVEILYMRLYSDRSDSREHDPELLKAGRDLLLRIDFRKDARSEGYRLVDIINASLKPKNTALIAAELVVRLRTAVAAREAYSFDHGYLLEALLKIQPKAVLDALFEGNEQEQSAGLEVLEQVDNFRNHPMDVISHEVLTAWCEENPGCRFLLAARIINLQYRREVEGQIVWSEQARALLSHAPDPKAVLEVFFKRFRTMMWTASNATQIEVNIQLLDSLEILLPSNLIPYLSQAKVKFKEEAARERQSETMRYRDRHERFE